MKQVEPSFSCLANFKMKVCGETEDEWFGGNVGMWDVSLPSALLCSDVSFPLRLCSPAHAHELQRLHYESRESCQAFARHPRRFFIIFVSFCFLSFTSRGVNFLYYFFCSTPTSWGDCPQAFLLHFFHTHTSAISIINVVLSTSSCTNGAPWGPWGWFLYPYCRSNLWS